MEAKPTTPYADLKAGISGKDLLDAINRSGYPFQAEVADHVRTAFAELAGSQIQEEWVYVDSETGVTRSLDIFAETPLWDVNGSNFNKKVRPYLNLLIECKQSDLPYVFFVRTNPVGRITVPDIAGVSSTDLRIFTKGMSAPREFSMGMSFHDVFACYNLEAFTGPPLTAISFAKAMRKSGGKLELSGEETYRGLTLPLMKASDYITTQSRAQREAKTVDLKLVVRLAVLRAPLIAAYLHHGKILMMGTPWVRACRVEPASGDGGQIPGSNVRYFDLVHSDFLPEYLELLVSDSRILAERMLACDKVIYTGAGLQNFEAVPTHGEEPDAYETLEELPEEYSEFIESGPMGYLSKEPDSVTFHFAPMIDDVEEGTILYVAPRQGSPHKTDDDNAQAGENEEMPSSPDSGNAP